MYADYVWRPCAHQSKFGHLLSLQYRVRILCKCSRAKRFSQLTVRDLYGPKCAHTHGECTWRTLSEKVCCMSLHCERIHCICSECIQPLSQSVSELAHFHAQPKRLQRFSLFARCFDLFFKKNWPQTWTQKKQFAKEKGSSSLPCSSTSCSSILE